MAKKITIWEYHGNIMVMMVIYTIPWILDSETKLLISVGWMVISWVVMTDSQGGANLELKPRSFHLGKIPWHLP